MEGLDVRTGAAWDGALACCRRVSRTMSRSGDPDTSAAVGGAGVAAVATSEPAGTSAPAGEFGDFVREHEQRRRQLPRAIVVGLLAGLVAVAFRYALSQVDTLRDRLVAFSWTLGWAGIALPVALAGAGTTIALVLVTRIAPEAAGSGIPHLKAVLYHLRGLEWRRVIAVKFVGGVAAIGCGLTLGREGPTVQMGGAVGQMVSGWFGGTPRERQTLIAAGAGAGLSAAFNAPLAGVVFVLEEVQRNFAPQLFAAALAATITADVVTRLLLGQFPVFHVRTHPIPPLESLPIAFATGVFAALLGIAFNRGLLVSLDLFDRFARRPRWVVGAVVGVAVGCVAWWAPGVVAGGHGLVESVLDGKLGLAAIALVFSLRFLLTLLSYGCGAPGGIFAPLLVLGATLGLAMAKIAELVWPAVTGDPATFAVVGMAAYFSAVVRAPLTGVVLMVEMTGDYTLVLPLVIASACAYGVAEFLHDRPIYEALLERDVHRSRGQAVLDRPLLIDLTVAPGAPFVGLRLRDLHLPSGCNVVSIARGIGTIVPVADSRLASGDQVTLLVSPEAAGAMPEIRRGMGCV
jgi:chloride channel protein, CIC family